MSSYINIIVIKEKDLKRFNKEFELCQQNDGNFDKVYKILENKSFTLFWETRSGYLYQTICNELGYSETLRTLSEEDISLCISVLDNMIKRREQSLQKYQNGSVDSDVSSEMEYVKFQIDNSTGYEQKMLKNIYKILQEQQLGDNDIEGMIQEANEEKEQLEHTHMILCSLNSMYDSLKDGKAVLAYYNS